MTSTASRHLLHADIPLRVWSLIVTIFGDAVMDRGTILRPPPLRTSDLMALLDVLGIDAGLARTSLSRLVANGTLERGRQGRNTFYNLSPASADEFARAAVIIYGTRPQQPVGDFLLAALDLCPERKEARAVLAARGFRFLSSTLAFLPRHAKDHRAGDQAGLPNGVIFSVSPADTVIAEAARSAWHIDDIDHAYARFVKDFGSMRAGDSGNDAIVTRIAAIHLFRRIVLRDPVLPQAVLPEGWHGQEARKVFDRLMAAARPASEFWLKQNGFRQFVQAGVLQRNM